MIALGTDGFGRSESREALRDHFEVDARHVVAATLSVLAREKQIDVKVVQAAFKDLGIIPKAQPGARVRMEFRVPGSGSRARLYDGRAGSPMYGGRAGSPSPALRSIGIRH